MSDRASAPAGAWDAGLYDRSFGFIADYGTDLLGWLDPQPGERILDLGCGVGQLTAEIAARGAEVVGLDADAQMIDRAQEKYPDLTFMRADGGDFALDEPVDAVFSNAALHWMKEPEPVIACVARVLKPGGRFVAEMGAHRNVATIIEALYQALAEQGVAREAVDFPWYFPRTSTYVRLLEDAGFDVMRLQYFRRPTPLDSCDNGLADWIRMFAGNFLAAAPPGVGAKVIARTEALTRDTLCADERWVADYTRLRFAALLT